MAETIENVTICITPKYSTTPETMPSSPADVDHLYDWWESVAADGTYTVLKRHTVKSLVHFAHYYGLTCGGKLNKDRLLEMIDRFESNPVNKPIVERRQTLWQSITVLKDDPYFSKFVLSNLLT